MYKTPELFVSLSHDLGFQLQKVDVWRQNYHKKKQLVHFVSIIK